MTSWLLATVHLLGLAIGLGAVWARARALRAGAGGRDLRRALAADNAWGVSAVLSLGTGLLRAFAGYEKGASYYLQSGAFHAKMALVALVLLLELWPMVTLVRARLSRRTAIAPAQALAFARISEVQALLLVLIVGLATAMARGMWF
jgi:putative membrane protein